ncbi:lytic enzyme [Accumulibacter sp.]|uniref:glycoside hydrolase family 19 protein n=1 Tax=Accumulibacter sp. TaxID=2053492 RepID=UPI0028C4E5F4|nr:lytic enzyme [Accumulibacter sp.]
MSVKVTLAQIAQLAPSARSSYREAFAQGQEVLDRFAISANPLRVAHFMAQILHESGGFTIQFENLNYSAQRLPKVWPTRFLPKGPLDPADFAHNQQKLANEVYDKRMGNTAANDGFTYRGRGFMQLTGKESYAQATTVLRQSFADTPDFTGDPDAVISADWCLKVAAAEWMSKGCNALADRDAVNAITRAINGGLIGLADRREWLQRTEFLWH